MENASKALIIAGAILLSILIIGLGMMIFTQAQNAMQGAGLDKEKIQTYNSDFEPYIKEKITGVDAKTLANSVKNHNAAVIKRDGKNDAETNPEIIILNTKWDLTDLDSERNKFKPGKNYSVAATYGEDGLIKTITTTEL